MPGGSQLPIPLDPENLMPLASAELANMYIAEYIIASKAKKMNG